MKPIAIVSIIALSSIGIGVFQQSRLAELKRESAELTGGTLGSISQNPVRHPQPRSVDSHPARGISSNESLADLENLMVGIFERITRSMDGQPVTAAEQEEAAESRERMMKALGRLNTADILKLIERLKSNPDLPEIFRQKPAEACFGFLADVNPQAVLDVIPRLKDFPNPGAMINNAFGNWIQMSPVAAIAWFDEESEKGNPLVGSPWMLRSVILAESRLDPSRALSLALSKEVAEKRETIVNLGANVATTLDGKDENLAFFSALRRESGKFPGSEELEEIRKTYVDGLGDLLYQWPFEDAVSLVDTEFTPSEKVDLAQKLSNRGDHDEPERWATWLFGAVIPPDGKHPLGDFFTTWCRIDPAAAGTWLDQAPPGDLKDGLVEKHAAIIESAAKARTMKPALDKLNAEMRAKIARQGAAASKGQPAPDGRGQSE